MRKIEIDIEINGDTERQRERERGCVCVCVSVYLSEVESGGGGLIWVGWGERIGADGSTCPKVPSTFSSKVLTGALIKRGSFVMSLGSMVYAWALMKWVTVS